MEQPAAKELQRCIADCVKFQDEVGVTWPILPSPLIEGPETLEQMLEWVDRGILEASSTREPLASIALSEKSIQDDSIVEALIDNLVARPLRGAYITLLRDDNTRRPSELRGCSLILRLVERLSSKRWRVITNFMDDFGLLCIALGGSGYATGYSNKERRLVRSDLEEKRGYGKQFPYFYSRSFFADFSPEADLEHRFAGQNLLWLFDEDDNVHSRPLLAGLREGLKANDIPTWRVRHANVEAAALHRAYVQRQVCGELNRLDKEGRIAAITRMLQNARRNAALVEEEFSTNPATADFRHIRPWLAAVKKSAERSGT